NLESRLYFVHKGIEKLFESSSLEGGVELAERISGDTSIGHALCYCRAVEALAGASVPERAGWLRMILLELERLYNHVGDVGAILTDTGFAVAHAHMLRLRETLLRCNARLAGHRLLRGNLVPGGLARDLPAPELDGLLGTVTRVLADFDEMVEI